MIKSVRTQAKAEEEFITLVGVVSEAVREARLHHQHTGVKVKRDALLKTTSMQHIGSLKLVSLCTL